MECDLCREGAPPRPGLGGGELGNERGGPASVPAILPLTWGALRRPGLRSALRAPLPPRAGGCGLVGHIGPPVSAELQAAQRVLEVPQRPPPKPGLCLCGPGRGLTPGEGPHSSTKLLLFIWGGCPRGMGWEIAGGIRRDTVLTLQRKRLV